MSTNKTKKQRTAPSLADLVVLLDNGLVSFLSLRDIRSLILVCPRSVSPEARDGVATALIRQECSNLDIHLGTQCYKNWCQLVPATIEGVNHSLYCDCDQSVWDDNDLADFPYHVKVPKCPPLPSLFDARPRLLDAMQLIREGIIEHCGYVFQLICLDNNDGVRFGTFQPVMVSVTTALEAQLEATTPQPNPVQAVLEADDIQHHHHESRREDENEDDEDEDEDEDEYDEDEDEEEYWDEDDFSGGERVTASERKRLRAIHRKNERLEHLRALERVKSLRKAATDASLQPIDTDNIEELTTLLNSMEDGFGTRFFASQEKQRRRAVGIVEEHWKRIEVNLDTDTTTQNQSTASPAL